MNSMNTSYNSLINDTNQSIYHEYTAAEIFSMVSYITEALVSLPISFILVYAILSRLELRQIHNVFILNLLLIENMQLLVQFLQAYNVYDGGHNVICAVAGFITYFGTGTSDINYAFIALNRYVALYHSNLMDVWFCRQNVTIMIVAAPLLEMMIGAVALYFNLFGFEELLICGIRLEGTGWLRPTFLTICVLVPFSYYSITAYCNIKVQHKIKYHKLHRIRSNLSRAQTSETESILLMLVIATTIPPLLEWPAVILKSVPQSCRAVPQLCRVATVLFGLKPTVSPYIIISCLPSYRKAVKSIMFRVDETPILAYDRESQQPGPSRNQNHSPNNGPIYSLQHSRSHSHMSFHEHVR